MELVRCSACRILQPVENFASNRSRKNGHTHACKECDAKSSHKRRYGTLEGYVYTPHRPRATPLPQPQAPTAKVRLTPEQLRAKLRARAIAAYAANPEKFRERRRKFYAANPEKGRKANRKSRLKHIEKRRAHDRAAGKQKTRRHPGRNSVYGAVRRARLRAVPVIDRVIDIDVLYKRDKGVCSLCLQKVDAKLKFPHPQSATVDHIIPITQGGEHSYRNTALAHFSCNAAKCDRIATQQMRLFG